MVKKPEKLSTPAEVKKANKEAQKSSGRKAGRPKKGEEIQYEDVELDCPKQMTVRKPGYGNRGTERVTCIKCGGTGKITMQRRKD